MKKLLSTMLIMAMLSTSGCAQNSAIQQSESTAQSENPEMQQSETDVQNEEVDSTVSEEDVIEKDTGSLSADEAGKKVTLAELMGKDDVSDEFKDVQERLNRNESVSNDEVLALPEFQWVEQHRTAGTSVDWDMFDEIREDGAGTITPESVKRMLPESIADRVMKVKSLLDEQGSAVFDSDGNVTYTGEVKQGKRLDLLIGLPASGKSTIAEHLSNKYGSLLGDSDVAKELTLKEMGRTGLIDEDYVHTECKLSNDMRLAEAAARGDNVVFSMIGNISKSLYERIAPFADNGYEIHVHYTDLPQNKALGRMLGRMAETSRTLDYVSVTELKPEDINDTFEKLKGDADIEETIRWNTDVAKGEYPIPVEYSGEDPSQLFSGRESGVENNLETGRQIDGNGSEGGRDN